MAGATGCDKRQSTEPNHHRLPLSSRLGARGVGPDTEETFDDAFWDSLDCVVNALDNIQAGLSDFCLERFQEVALSGIRVWV